MQVDKDKYETTNDNWFFLNTGIECNWSEKKLRLPIQK